MAATKERPDVVGYLLSHPDALAIVRTVRDGGAHSPEDIRRALGLHPESFRRARQVLAAHRLITVHAAKGATWQETPDGHLSLRVVIELGPRARSILPLLEGFGRVARTHRGKLESPVIEEVGSWG